jgi:Spy/CpxP family protein refolding chaperone
MISSTRRAAVLLLATFVLGAAAGAGLMAYASRTPPPPPAQGRAAWYLHHLTRNLDLTAVQQDSVKAVLDRYTPAMDSLMSEIRPRLDTVRTAMRAEITRFLDPRQQKEYEAMRQKHERDRRAGGSNGR